MQKLYVVPNTGLAIFRGIKVMSGANKIGTLDYLLRRYLAQHRPTQRSGLLDWCLRDDRKILGDPKTTSTKSAKPKPGQGKHPTGTKHMTRWLPIGEDQVDHQCFVRPYREGDTLRTDVCIDTSDASPTQGDSGFVLTLRLRREWWRRMLRLKSRNLLLDLCEVVVLGEGGSQGEASSVVPVREYHAALDFGNTSCAIGLQSIFDDEDERVVPLEEWLGAEPMNLHDDDADGSAFDESGLGNLDTNISILSGGEPVWAAMGRASRDVKRAFPSITRVSNPKKYIRCYEKREHERYITFRGMDDSSPREPISISVGIALRRLLQLLFEYEKRPSEGENHPGSLPLVRRIHATFPLLWREQERELFATKLRQTVEEALQDLGMEPPSVELVASEPEAVAAYFFSELSRGLDAEGRRSVLGCLRLGDPNTEKLRALFVDLGGGTTDISLVECDFVEDAGNTRPATRVCAYDRIGRAGDRVTHLMVVRLLAYLFGPQGRIPNLELRSRASSELTADNKNQIISILLDICEVLKRELSTNDGQAVLDPQQEPWKLRLQQLREAGLSFRDKLDQNFKIDSRELLDSLAQDTPAARIPGRQGFGDLFMALGSLHAEAISSAQPIHLCILSGRTSRLHGLADAINRHSGIPRHRIFRIGELLPQAGDGADKFSVVRGALRFAKGSVVHSDMEGGVQRLSFDIGLRSEGAKGLSPIWARQGEIPGHYEFTLDPLSYAVIAAGASGRRPYGVARVYNSSARRQQVQVEAIDAYRYRLIEPSNGDVELSHLFPGGIYGGDDLADSGSIDREEGLHGFLAQLR